jgi:hypothetical protein
VKVFDGKAAFSGSGRLSKGVIRSSSYVAPS